MTREDIIATFDVGRLQEPGYFGAIEAQLRARTHISEAIVARWFLEPHTHRCPRCQREITHTGLEATRDGPEAHRCCNRDVRTGGLYEN